MKKRRLNICPLSPAEIHAYVPYHLVVRTSFRTVAQWRGMLGKDKRMVGAQFSDLRGSFVYMRKEIMKK